MYKDGILTISDWISGIAKYPTNGFGSIQNIEILENPGIARMTQGAILDTRFSGTSLAVAQVKDVYGNQYVATGADTGSGYVSKLTGGGTVNLSGSLSNIWDLCIFKNYLWCRNGGNISAYGPLSASNATAQWFNNIYTGFNNDGYYGKLLSAIDPVDGLVMFTTNKNQVSKINVTSSGTPAVAPTLVITLTALNLPDGYYANNIIEYGKNLMIACSGGLNFNDSANFGIARIYPWNRQAGTLGNPGLADLPVIFNENGITQMIVHGNRMFCVAGITGNVYETNSVSYVKIATIPFSNNYNTAKFYPNAIAISENGTLLIGSSTGTGTFNRNDAHGIWEIDINNPKYPVTLKKTLSTGNVGANQAMSIGFITPGYPSQMFWGWKDGTTYGMDTTSYLLCNNFNAIIESPLYKVGYSNTKKTFQNIEWCLTEPLVDGQSIRLLYRKNIKSSWNLIKTWDYATVGERLSLQGTAAITDAEFVQIRAELSQEDSTIFGSNINLAEIRLW